MIEAGIVYVDGRKIEKPAFDTADDAAVTVEGAPCPYVGRGGYKLAGALDAFSMDVSGFTCVDIGASTGGFTDCLLQRGAASVCCIDSGTGQLHQSLREDSRVSVHEGFHAKNLDETVTGGRVMFCVCDVSFISLTHIFAPVTRILLPYHPQNAAGSFLALIKPQFEAGREYIGKNGIVRDIRVHLRVVENVLSAAEAYGLYGMDVIPSPIMGGDGNREFLAHFAFDAPAYKNAALWDHGYLQKKLQAQ